MIGPITTRVDGQIGPAGPRSWGKLRALLFVTMVTTLLGACASTDKVSLTRLALPSPDWADVILYRHAASWAGHESFDVFVDDEPVAVLPNGSALWFRVRPGAHHFRVEPGGIRRSASLNVFAEGGHRQFLHYDFATRALASPTFDGSAIRHRDALDGHRVVARLQLVGERCKTACPLTPIVIDTAIAIDDVDAVPTLTPQGRAGYRAWLRQPPPRAFVLGSGGQWHASWGRQSVERAIQQCRASGNAECRLYAVDHRVVWTPR